MGMPPLLLLIVAESAAPADATAESVRSARFERAQTGHGAPGGWGAVPRLDSATPREAQHVLCTVCVAIAVAKAIRGAHRPTAVCSMYRYVLCNRGGGRAARGHSAVTQTV
jgi:hypothetical protein